MARGIGKNPADLVVDEADAAAAGARVGVAASTEAASQLVVEAVRCRDAVELVADETDAAAAGAHLDPSSLRTFWRRSPIVPSSLVWRSPNAVSTAFSSLAFDSAKRRSRSQASWARRTSYVARPSGERVARSSARRRDAELVCWEYSMELIGEILVENRTALMPNVRISLLVHLIDMNLAYNLGIT